MSSEPVSFEAPDEAWIDDDMEDLGAERLPTPIKVKYPWYKNPVFPLVPLLKVDTSIPGLKLWDVLWTFFRVWNTSFLSIGIDAEVSKYGINIAITLGIIRVGFGIPLWWVLTDD
jgi:hypothetical protein